MVRVFVKWYLFCHWLYNFIQWSANDTSICTDLFLHNSWVSCDVTKEQYPLCLQNLSSLLIPLYILYLALLYLPTYPASLWVSLKNEQLLSSSMLYWQISVCKHCRELSECYPFKGHKMISNHRNHCNHILETMCSLYPYTCWHFSNGALVWHFNKISNIKPIGTNRSSVLQPWLVVDHNLVRNSRRLVTDVLGRVLDNKSDYNVGEPGFS